MTGKFNRHHFPYQTHDLAVTLCHIHLSISLITYNSRFWVPALLTMESTSTAPVIIKSGALAGVTSNRTIAANQLTK